MPLEKCPICKQPTAHDFRPFCSARCKLLDLQNWFTGAYAVPVVEQDSSEDINLEKSDKIED
jgi:uncharacterized protein